MQKNKNGWIELYRQIVPSGKIINDNSGQHYRIMQGKMQYLNSAYNAWKAGEPQMLSTIGGFQYHDPEEVLKEIGDHLVDLRLEVWKAKNQRFDCHNYAKTFKELIDMLDTDGFMHDDSWKYIRDTTFGGGGINAWNRSYRTRMVEKDDEAIQVSKTKRGITLYEVLSDGLPREMTPNWWREYTDDFGGIFIRILIKVTDEKITE